MLNLFKSFVEVNATLIADVDMPNAIRVPSLETAAATGLNMKEIK